MKYTYFEKAIIAMVSEMKTLFKNYGFVSNLSKHQDFPVYIQNSGDRAYMEVHSNEIKEVSKTEKIILPALVLHFRGVSINEDEKTNETQGAITLKHNGFEQEYTGEVQHYPCEIRMEGTFLGTDIFQYLSFVEYMMNGVYKNKPFNFKYMGKNMEGTIVMETTDHDPEYNEITNFEDFEEMSSHNSILAMNVKLQYPSFNLNSSLSGDVDESGDGIYEGGIGIPVNMTKKGDVIKSVISYTDLEKINKPVGELIVGDNFPENLKKKLQNE
ncbi:hypothetical protein BPT24_107 [Tenacibaculum phage pT24]|uniref:Uncharacterized protein n=1 Tax=Tenacibaculum phage pT24 TaxID=1880590 RepID=A0A1B4XWN7_9CAUD|nr:hypothetical protein HYP10_gp107 [Tenacibaculum phage pT24]BAV39232.1 hypothetical protein BPT24_107 [Tenacibaculum phage pT24]